MLLLVYLLAKYTCNSKRKLALEFFLTWYVWLVKSPPSHIWAASLHRKQAQPCQDFYEFETIITEEKYRGKAC